MEVTQRKLKDFAEAAVERAGYRQEQLAEKFVDELKRLDCQLYRNFVLALVIEQLADLEEQSTAETMQSITNLLEGMGLISAEGY